MDRDDLKLYTRIREAVDDYGLEYILEVNDLTPEDAIFHLIRLYGLELPDAAS